MKKKVVAITTIALLSSSLGTNALASTYQVQKGDTLTKIAKKHNTSISQIKTWNQLSSDLIYVNQTLKVAGNVVAPKPAAPKPAAPKPSAPTATAAPSSYTVVKGDTLSKIASKHKISLSDLMKWNNLDHHIIYPGQKLKVSVTSTTVVVTEPPKAKPVTQPAHSSEYVVQKGDTLGAISGKYGMTVAELKQLNQLSSDIIYIGQKLKVQGDAAHETAVPPAGTEETVTSDFTNELIDTAKAWMGIPYVWGGSSLSGFDCSGFIYYAFNEVGTKISRLSTEGYYSRSYYVDSPKAGDLVFFENTYKQGISHMGIYLGNNEFLHASTSKGVTISSLNEAYYQQRFDGFKRFY